jgi:hypothetical protein
VPPKGGCLRVRRLRDLVEGDEPTHQIAFQLTNVIIDFCALKPELGIACMCFSVLRV